MRCNIHIYAIAPWEADTSTIGILTPTSVGKVRSVILYKKADTHHRLL